MDRIINVKIGGNHLSKDNKNAGVRGEANVTRLRITFDESWDGYAKKVTFWDAFGTNPVERILTTDLVENLAEGTRIYLVPIPAEPMTEAGMLTFVVDGYIDGKRQRSFSDKLVVKDAPITDNAGEPADPTPTQAEQLQGEIDSIMETIHEANKAQVAAEEAQDAAEAARDEATANAKEAKNMAERAEWLSVAVQGSVIEAEGYAQKAEEAVGKTSYIGDDGNWYTWNSTEGGFYDTGVKAQSGSTVYLGDNPPPEADVWIDTGGEGDATLDINAHISDAEIHVTAKEKTDLSMLPNTYTLALETNDAFNLHQYDETIHTTVEEKADIEQNISTAQETAEKSLQYWKPNTLYKEGQVVYAHSDGDEWDYISECLTTHTSADSYDRDYSKWDASISVTANKAWWSRYANTAEYDYDGNDIIATYATKAKLATKADKPTIITDTKATSYTFDFSDMYNSEMRLQAASAVSIIFRDDEYAEDYISGLSFDSGDTPTGFDYTESGIINWVGTDCVKDGELSIFQPSANTHYDIVFYFNGTQFIGLVNGFVPAAGNEAV